MGELRTAADVIAERLAAHLGPNTARTAVRTFAARSFGCRPDEISRAQAPRLLDALRPMLRTLLGQDRADAVLADIEDALREASPRETSAS